MHNKLSYRGDGAGTGTAATVIAGPINYCCCIMSLLLILYTTAMNIFNITLSCNKLAAEMLHLFRNRCYCAMHLRTFTKIYNYYGKWSKMLSMQPACLTKRAIGCTLTVSKSVKNVDEKMK